MSWPTDRGGGCGRVIAEGTSDELKDKVGGNRIEIAVAKEPTFPAPRGGPKSVVRRP